MQRNLFHRLPPAIIHKSDIFIFIKTKDIKHMEQNSNSKKKSSF